VGIESRSFSLGACLPVAGERRIDETRIDLRKLLIADPEPGAGSWGLVGNENIGRTYELPQDGSTSLVLEFYPERTLAARGNVSFGLQY
jgi:hypothetical protein